MGRQWTADIIITVEMVQTLLSVQFSELSYADVQVLDAGWDNSVFLVNRNCVFRFPRRKVAVELIEMENRVLPWLSSRLPLAIPNPRFVGEPTPEYPFPFSGYFKINGSVPHRLNLNDTKRAESSVHLAQFLRVLHSIPTDLAIDRGVPASDNIGRMDIEKHIPMFVAKVEEAYNKRLVQDPHALLTAVDKLPRIERNGQSNKAVVHGDLNFRNFLVDDDGTPTGVIDWGDVHIGHPAIDLSLVYSYLPPAARPNFFEVYGEVHPETLLLAYFRALYANIVILIYAHDIGDARQVLEAQRSISNTLS